MAEKMTTTNGSTPVRPAIKKADTDKDLDDYFVSGSALSHDVSNNSHRSDLETLTTTRNGQSSCVFTAVSHPR